MAANHLQPETAKELEIVYKLNAIVTALKDFNEVYKTYSGGNSASLNHVLIGSHIDTIKPNFGLYYDLLK